MDTTARLEAIEEIKKLKARSAATVNHDGVSRPALRSRAAHQDKS